MAVADISTLRHRYQCHSWYFDSLRAPLCVSQFQHASSCCLFSGASRAGYFTYWQAEGSSSQADRSGKTRITSAVQATGHTERVQLSRQHLWAMHVLSLCSSCDRALSLPPVLHWSQVCDLGDHPLLLTGVKWEIHAYGMYMGVPSALNWSRSQKLINLQSSSC